MQIPFSALFLNRSLSTNFANLRLSWLKLALKYTFLLPYALLLDCWIWRLFVCWLNLYSVQPIILLFRSGISFDYASINKGKRYTEIDCEYIDIFNRLLKCFFCQILKPLSTVSTATHTHTHIFIQNLSSANILVNLSQFVCCAVQKKNISQHKMSLRQYAALIDGLSERYAYAMCDS